VPYAAYIAAELIRLNESKSSFGKLREFLNEHPGFKPVLGFGPMGMPTWLNSFNTQPLPSARHFTRMLRQKVAVREAIPNASLQFLLTDSVRLIGEALQTRNVAWGNCISLDTKHILAWVQENNPKAYVTESGRSRGHRFDKNKQPASGPLRGHGDPDCRLGCNPRQPGAYAATINSQHRP